MQQLNDFMRSINKMNPLRFLVLIALIVALSWASASLHGYDFIPHLLGVIVAVIALKRIEIAYTKRQYEKGIRDCKKGLPHKEGRHEEYDQGYGFQYMKDQMESANSEHQ